jgi:hypothetical protein
LFTQTSDQSDVEQLFCRDGENYTIKWLKFFKDSKPFFTGTSNLQVDPVEQDFLDSTAVPNQVLVPSVRSSVVHVLPVVLLIPPGRSGHAPLPGINCM